MGNWLTVGLIVQYVVLAAVELFTGRHHKALYWTGAAILTVAVLWSK